MSTLAETGIAGTMTTTGEIEIAEMTIMIVGIPHAEMIAETDVIASIAGTVRAEVMTAGLHRAFARLMSTGSRMITTRKKSIYWDDAYDYTGQGYEGPDHPGYYARRRPREPDYPPQRKRWRNDYSHQGGWLDAEWREHRLQNRQHNPPSGGVQIKPLVKW